MKIDLGINIGAGTWGIESDGTPIPGGVHGSQYWYPKPAELDLAAANGVRAVRMGSAVSRVYATPDGATVNPDVELLKAAVRDARELGMRVYFEFHEYGFQYGQRLTVDTVRHTVRAFEPLAEFKNDPGFIPCSWNEPHAILKDAAGLSGYYWPILTAWHRQMRDAGWGKTMGVSAANWAGFGQINEQIDKFLALGDPNILIEGHYYFDIPATQWASWSGPGHGSSVWALTEADIGTQKFTDTVETNFARAFGGNFAKLRTAGLRSFIGETSIPFGPVGNAVRRALLPKWEENADVLADRLLWIGAQHQSASDPNRLFAETTGADGKKIPVAAPLLLDEVAARREFMGMTDPVTPPAEPTPTPAPTPTPTPTPTADPRDARIAELEAEVANLKARMAAAKADIEAALIDSNISENANGRAMRDQRSALVELTL